MPLLGDKEDYIRQAAIAALGQFSAQVKDVSPLVAAIMPLLGDKEDYIRQAAITALGQFSAQVKDVGPLVAAIMPLLGDKEDYIRQAAIAALGQFSAQVKDVSPLVAAIMPLLGDKDSGVRKATIAALVQLSAYVKDVSPLVIAIMKALLADRYNSGVWVAALAALGQLSTRLADIGPVVTALMPLLADRYSNVWVTALAVLGQLSTRLADIGPVVTAIMPLLRNKSQDVSKVTLDVIKNLAGTIINHPSMTFSPTTYYALIISAYFSGNISLYINWQRLEKEPNASSSTPTFGYVLTGFADKDAFSFALTPQQASNLRQQIPELLKLLDNQQWEKVSQWVSTQTFKPVPHPENDLLLPEYRAAQKGTASSSTPLLTDYGRSKTDNKKTAKQYGLSEHVAVLPPSTERPGCAMM
jgi:HEAT repeat protein